MINELQFLKSLQKHMLKIHPTVIYLTNRYYLLNKSVTREIFVHKSGKCLLIFLTF